MAKHPMDDALAQAEAYLKQRQAERRLAEAAPDLLRVCRSIVRFSSMMPSGLVADARAAIAKAEGK